MPTYTVFHANPEVSHFGFAPARFPADFQKVAAVVAEDTGEVFQLTNHIDADWTQNPNVVAEPGPQRSTSVGDVIVDENGVLFAIAPIGLQTFAPGAALIPALCVNWRDK